MHKQSMFTLFLAILCLPVYANNITVSTPTLTNGSAADGYGYVTFDLSWDNSWRLSSGISNSGNSFYETASFAPSGVVNYKVKSL